MWDKILLPDEYKVKKKLSLKNFLAKANLTKTEADELASVISSIDLKYDIKFNDKSEIIFFDVKIKYQKNSWTSRDVARGIAQSIPYNSIIYVHDNSFGDLSVFVKRENKKNDRRSMLIRQSVVPIFDIYNIPSNTVQCLNDICFIVKNKEENASSAALKCVNIIDEYKEKYKRYNDLFEDIQEDQKIIQMLQRGLEGAPFYEDLDQKNYYYSSDYDLEEDILYDLAFYLDDGSSDTEIVKPFSEEALCKCAYLLYCDSEYFCADGDISNWLFNYAKCCNDVLVEMYNIEPDYKFYYDLGDSFRLQDRNPGDEYEDDAAVKVVKEMISEEECYA